MRSFLAAVIGSLQGQLEAWRVVIESAHCYWSVWKKEPAKNYKQLSNYKLHKKNQLDQSKVKTL